MNNLKQLLLESEQFIDCEALDDYVKLIEKNRDNEVIEGKTNKHHILPESLFTTRGLPENNSPECVVNLMYKDHILAHYYLWEAAKPESRQSYCNSYAVCFMTNTKEIPNKDSLLSDLSRYQEMREAWHLWNKKINTGKVLSEETKKKIGDAARDRIKSEHTRKLLSAALTGRKLSEEHKQSLRHPKSTTINMKKPKSEQAKINMSLSKIGKTRGPRPDHVREKISKTLMGHPVSEETRKASIAANTDKKCLFKDGEYKWFFTEIDIATALQAGWILKGRPKSEDNKKALSIAHTGRIWITDGIVTKKIKDNEFSDYEKLGFRKGRK